MKRLLACLLILCVLASCSGCGLLVLAEDTIVIFSFDMFSAVGLKINNRNFSENLLFFGLAAVLIWNAVRYLARLPEDCKEDFTALIPTPKDSVARRFCLQHGLTDRECEIFEQLLNGKSQQEISEDLIIALGTVKTHIHNIYQKTGAGNRNQLTAQFQNFSRQTETDSTDSE